VVPIALPPLRTFMRAPPAMVALMSVPNTFSTARPPRNVSTAVPPESTTSRPPPLTTVAFVVPPALISRVPSKRTKVPSAVDPEPTSKVSPGCTVSVIVFLLVNSLCPMSVSCPEV
jgi:hypothetical protein